MNDNIHARALRVVDKLIQELEDQGEIQDAMAASGWLVVTYDPMSGSRQHVGPFGDIISASEHAIACEEQSNRGMDPNDPSFVCSVVPLFAPDDEKHGLVND